jgi:hypothetical protein
MKKYSENNSTWYLSVINITIHLIKLNIMLLLLRCMQSLFTEFSNTGKKGLLGILHIYITNLQSKIYRVIFESIIEGRGVSYTPENVVS